MKSARSNPQHWVNALGEAKTLSRAFKAFDSELVDDWTGDVPTWKSDNRVFVVEFVLPRLEAAGRLRPSTKQIIRWAYGYDGSNKSWEEESDGSSVVPDVWGGGDIKEPFGVAHDMLFRIHKIRQPLPNGKTWGWWKTNVWYYKAMKDFGMCWRAPVRFLGLSLGSLPVWWGKAGDKF